MSAVALRDLLDANPIEVLRRDALEGAGYVERLVSDRASVALWNRLRALGARITGGLLPRPEPLRAAEIAEILEHGFFLPVVEGRLGTEDLVRLLRSPEQLEDLARRAEEESEYFRSWRKAVEG